MDNRRMCPHCRAFITTSDRVCPYCGDLVGARAVDIRSPAALLGGLIPAEMFTTSVILLINLGLYVASYYLGRTMGDGPALWALGGKLGRSIFIDREFWRLITAGFLHGSLMHILFNSWALYQLGPQVEQLFETPRYLVIYFVSTVGGFYASARFNSHLSIGASAGIMGLIGAMIAFGVVNKTSIGRQIRNFYLGWLGFNLLYGFMNPSIDNWAHIGGFAGGFAVAYISGTPVHSTRAREAMWWAIAAICVLLTAYSFFEVYRHFPTLNDLR